jgi:hypothetical protein
LMDSVETMMRFAKKMRFVRMNQWGRRQGVRRKVGERRLR